MSWKVVNGLFGIHEALLAAGAFHFDFQFMHFSPLFKVSLDFVRKATERKKELARIRREIHNSPESRPHPYDLIMSACQNF